MATPELRVMQLNAWLIPVRPNFPKCLDFHAFGRAKRLAKWIEAEAVAKRLDVCILQEVWTPWRSVVAGLIHSAFCCQLFGRSLVENALKSVLPYMSKVEGSYPCDCTKRFFDSGLMIASKFPIIEQTFQMYPPGSPHDALSSKGVLVAALKRPDSTILIVASSHLDAGDDDEVKLSQLRIALGVIREFVRKIANKFSVPISAVLFGADMNIDGVEFWRSDTFYGTARQLMEADGFVDSWLLTDRPVAASAPYGPDSHPELGITSDQHNCVKRLDYLWTKQGGAPVQEMMGKKNLTGHAHLSEGAHWRSSVPMRAAVAAAHASGDVPLATQLAEEMDIRDRTERLSDHAALYVTLKLPH